MKFIFSILLVAALSATANAQCIGGNCRARVVRRSVVNRVVQPAKVQVVEVQPARVMETRTTTVQRTRRFWFPRLRARRVFLRIR